MEIEREAEGRRKGEGQGGYRTRKTNFSSDLQRRIYRFAPGVLNIRIICLFVRLFLTMPSRGRRSGVFKFRLAVGHCAETPAGSLRRHAGNAREMRLIGKTRFGRYVYDREIFFWRRQ